MMTRAPRVASGVSWSCSCTSCLLKRMSQCPFDEIMFVYERYIPLRERLLNEFIKSIFLANITEDPARKHHKNGNQTRWFSETKSHILETDYLIDNIEWQYTKLRKCTTNYSEELLTCNKIRFPQETALGRAGGSDTGPAHTVSAGSTRSRRLPQLQASCCRGNKIKLMKSDSCTCTLKAKGISKRQIESRQHKKDKEINEMTNMYSQIMEYPTSIPKKNEIPKRGQPAILKSSLSMASRVSDTHLLANRVPAYSSENPLNLNKNCDLSKTSIMVLLPKAASSKSSFESWKTILSFFQIPYNGNQIHLLNSKKKSPTELFAKQYTSEAELLGPRYIAQTPDVQTIKFQRQPQILNLKVVIGPYAQTQVVYNVMEQTTSQMKEKGTSQQFKKRNQGISTASSIEQGASSTNDSSTGTPKRRAIKIESSVSFSIEFFNKRKSTASDIPGHEETGAQKGKAKIKEGKEKKKALHRCLCTLSFPPVDGIKPEACAPGVCVSGECNASECFKRIQQKYASKKKKKSGSEASSSQKSQTRKVKPKEERAGKETFVKEKGSSSISTYKETVEIKPRPEKKSEGAGFLTKCCKKLRCWKKGDKDESIALKHAVTDTNIADKTKAAEPFGSSTATQSGKKTDKKKDKSKEVKPKEVKAKEVKPKEVKGATGIGEGDKKAAGKKDKKADKKGKKETEKESTGVGGEVKKATGKKGKKETKKEATAPAGEAKKAEKKGKKESKKETTAPAGEAKKMEKKGKKETKKEPPPPAEAKKSEKKGKKDTKGSKGTKEPEKAKEKIDKTTGKKKKIKKGRPLKPYECEPGVCTPGVCSPQECFNRKFPPPPPKEVVQLTNLGKIKILMRKCCCRPTIEGEKQGTASLNVATQSRKAPGAEGMPGATVYKEKGLSGPKQSKKQREAAYDQPIITPEAVGRKSGKEQGPPGVDVGIPEGAEGADYGRSKKQRGFTGVQYYQNIDNEQMTNRQGVNIGSECCCSVEFYKMVF